MEGYFKEASQQRHGDAVFVVWGNQPHIAQRQTRPLGGNVVNYIPAPDRTPDPDGNVNTACSKTPGPISCYASPPVVETRLETKWPRGNRRNQTRGADRWAGRRAMRGPAGGSRAPLVAEPEGGKGWSPKVRHSPPKKKRPASGGSAGGRDVNSVWGECACAESVRRRGGPIPRGRRRWVPLS